MTGPADDPTQRAVALRSIAVVAFLPTLIFEIGQGAITPVVALSGLHLGASVGQAGLLLALLGVGRIAGDVPAGALAARIGDRRAMLVAAGLAVLTLTGCALSRSVWLLAVAITLTGATNAVFMLARQSYLTETIPLRLRARALSTLGGVARVGGFVGPFLGALIITGGSVQRAYWVALVAAVLVVAVLLKLPDVENTGPVRPHRTDPGFRAVLGGHGKLLGTLGVTMLLFSAVRGARTTVLPLWANHLHIGPAATSIVFGIAGGLDMLLFYPSGKVMDAAGRLWVAVPSMLVLGLGFLLLPLSRSLLTLTLAALVLGLGNGISSGVLLTLGADVAPTNGRSRFLGVWRVFSDSGNAGGPLLVAGLAALGSLAAGVLVIGGLAVATAGALRWWVPRWSPWAFRRPAPARPVRPATVEGSS